MGNKKCYKKIKRKYLKKLYKDRAKNMRESKRFAKLNSGENVKGCMEAALTEDAWISCQTDVNKLVQRNGCPEEDNLSVDAFDDEAGVISMKEQMNLIDEVITPEQFKKMDEVDEKPEILLTPVITNEIDNKIDILPFQSPDEWVIKKSLCRCCHAEGTFTSLQETAQGEVITHEHMLKSCFNIQLFTVSGAMGAVCTVCALCAVRLRDAYAFSQQVRACEAHFRDLYQKNIIKVPTAEIELKVEPQDENDDFNFEMDTAVDAPHQPVVEQEVNTKKMEAKRNNDKNTSKKKRKETASKGKKPRGGKHKARPFTSIGDFYKCSQCDTIRETIQKIQYHIRMTHTDYRPQKCTHCPKAFKTPTQLTIHKLDEHNIDARHKCNACDKIFNMERQLLAHTKTYHMMGEKIMCSMCDYECYDKSVLRKHLVMHKTTKDFHCKYCKKSFLRKTTLRFHERIHTGDKRKACAECGQKFVQKASLNYHMAKYHPEVKF